MISDKKSLFALLILILLTLPVWAFSFAVFGDNRDGDKVLLDIIGRINQDKDIAFAVNTGDLVPSGKESQYKHYVDMLKKCNVKIYDVAGNHDVVGQGSKWFRKYIGPDVYSFDYENAHFIILNNSFKGVFDRRQYDFLLSELEANKDKQNFVFFHRPMFDPSEVYPNYVMSERKTAEKLMETFARYRVRYVIAGHIHGYAKATRDSVVYMVTGGAGAPLYLPNYLGGYYHYVKITVEGNKIKDELVKL